MLDSQLKTVVIAGGTGFIGQALVKALQTMTEYKLIILGRDEKKAEKIFAGAVDFVAWQDVEPVLGALQPTDMIINLCGTNIGEKRWSDKQKEKIKKSRIESTQRLAHFCRSKGEQSPKLINASAIGIYGLQQTVKDSFPSPLDEQTPICEGSPADFLSDVGCAWENTLGSAIDAGCSVTMLRFAVVLGIGGGALSQMLLPFQLGLGGRIGSGDQAMSWVALPDVIRAIVFIMKHPEMTGPFNIVSPCIVKQKDFAKALGLALNRPTFMPMPAALVRLVFGREMADELLLGGQNVTPKRLLEAGFQFKHPDLTTYLKEHLKS